MRPMRGRANIGKPITLHVEPTYVQEEYDIILA